MEIQEVIRFEPFKTIWASDKKPGKAAAKRNIEYVYYAYARDPDNPYKHIPESERIEELNLDYFSKAGSRNPEENEQLQWALEKWKRMNSSIEDKLLDSAIRLAERLAEFFDDATFDKKSLSDGSIQMFIDQLQKVQSTMQKLTEIRNSAERSAEIKRARGKVQVNERENPNNRTKQNVPESED